jgi:PRC-barrel domain
MSAAEQNVHLIEPNKMCLLTALFLSTTCCFGATLATAQNEMPLAVIVAQHQTQSVPEQPVTPEERMRRRFPQPVLVGDLIGLRVLDDNDVTIGIVRHVARTPDGKVKLIVAHTGPLGWGGRLVAVPIEAVAIFGRQLASLDMQPAEYASAATWNRGGSQLLELSEKILIGLTRR